MKDILKARGGLWIRLVLTILAPILVVLGTRHVPLPLIDAGEVLRRLNLTTAEVNLSVFALGLTPVFHAFLLVELAALCVPRWRAYRNGGPSGRGRLAVAAVGLTLAVALLMSLVYASELPEYGGLEEGARLPMLVVVLTMASGTFALLALARILDRAALGGGLAIIATTFAVLESEDWLQALRAPSWGTLTLLLAGAVTVLALRWRPRQGPPLPACGVIPLQWGAPLTPVVMMLLASATPAGWMAARADRQFLSFLLASSMLTALFALVLGLLFNRPAKVEAFGPGAGGVARAVALSAAFVLVLDFLAWLLGRQLSIIGLELVAMAAAVALVLDVIAEARAIGRHGDLVAVWPEHRVYAVQSALDALARHGIPALSRSAYQRALWHFFAPFIPIQIMVPRAHAQEAGRLLHEHFGVAPVAPPPSGSRSV